MTVKREGPHCQKQVAATKTRSSARSTSSSSSNSSTQQCVEALAQCTLTRQSHETRQIYTQVHAHAACRPRPHGVLAPSTPAAMMRCAGMSHTLLHCTVASCDRCAGKAWVHNSFKASRQPVLLNTHKYTHYMHRWRVMTTPLSSRQTPTQCVQSTPHTMARSNQLRRASKAWRLHSCLNLLGGVVVLRPALPAVSSGLSASCFWWRNQGRHSAQPRGDQWCP